MSLVWVNILQVIILIWKIHAKTGLKIFVVVVPQEDLAGISPPKASFGMTLTIEFYSVVFTDYILQSVPYKVKAWLAWCLPSLLLGLHRWRSHDLFLLDVAHKEASIKLISVFMTLLFSLPNWLASDSWKQNSFLGIFPDDCFLIVRIFT